MSDITTIHGTRIGSVRVVRGAFRSSAKFSEAYPKTVFFDCSDGRFTASDEEFLAGRFGERYADELSLPGGAALYHPLSEPDETTRAAARKALEFLVQHHGTERIIVASHDACGHYRARYPALPGGDLTRIQLSDLVTVGHLLHKAHPRCAVHAFFKIPDATGRINYDEIILV